MVYYAQNIQTGNSHAQSSVISNVQDGNVITHIETTANGQTNVIDANGNGQISVNNDNGKVSITKTPQVTIVQTQTLSSTPTPTIILKNKSSIKTLSATLLKEIQNFFKQFFRQF